jgi:hypothetical protein
MWNTDVMTDSTHLTSALNGGGWWLPSRAGSLTIGAHSDRRLCSPQKQNVRGREEKALRSCLE